MEKRGQFYLIGAIIIIAIIFGFATITNTLKKEEFRESYDAAEELEIESRYVLDNAVLNTDMSVKDKLLDFTEKYSTYSNAENLYFVFGDTDEISVAARQKNYPGRILVNGAEFEIGQGVYTSNSYLSPPNPTIIMINEIEHEFELKQGSNFYFILAEGKEEGGYFFTGNMIKKS